MMIAVIRYLAAVLLLAMTVSGSQSPAAEFPGLSGYRIDRLGITLLLPESAYITDRSVSSDYEPLDQFGMTAQELEVQYKKGNIYCNAIWYPESTDMTEIIVAMTEDDDSRAIFRLSDYDQLYLNALADSYAAFTQQGQSVTAMYTEATLTQTGQATFVRARGVRRSEDAAENHLHYMTVENGQRIEITLIEHYSDPERGTSFVLRENELMMDEIIDSLRFDELKNEFAAKNGTFMTGLYIVLSLSALLIISYIVSKIRVSRAERAAEAAEERNEDVSDESCGTEE